MKKLGKLSINPERVMKNEELVNLRGGEYYSGSYCDCICEINGEQINKPYTAGKPADCVDYCGYYYSTYPPTTLTNTVCKVLWY